MASSIGFNTILGGFTSHELNKLNAVYPPASNTLVKTSPARIPIVDAGLAKCRPKLARLPTHPEP